MALAQIPAEHIDTMEILVRADSAGATHGTDRLHDKTVTVFTDEPEQFAPDSVLHPIYDALYQQGAVVLGPRALDLGGARSHHQGSESTGPMSESRLQSAVSRPAAGQDRGAAGRRALSGSSR